MKAISHPNIVKLKYYYYEHASPNAEEVYLNLVLEFIPETIYRTYRQVLYTNRLDGDLWAPFALCSPLRAPRDISVMSSAPLTVLISRAGPTARRKCSSPRFCASSTCSRYGDSLTT